MKPVSILLVDDHPMVIEGLKAIFDRIKNIEVKGSAGDAHEAIAFLQHNSVDLALIDINLPQISGIELCQRIKTEYSQVMVLGMSTFRERNYISQMIQAGASGYLVKSASREEIVQAVEAAMGGKLYVSVDVSPSVSPSKIARSTPILTQREKEVLALIAEGYTNHQMAEKLFISPHTIDSHRKNLLNKFEVKNTAALINIAIRLNLLKG